MLLFTIVAIIAIVVCVCIGATIGDSAGSVVLGAILGLAVGLALTGYFHWRHFGTETTVTFTVAGKERIAEDGDGKWVVYAKPGPGIGDGNAVDVEDPGAVGETFENTDDLFHGKTRSTDLQNTLRVGRAYHCQVNGVRVGFFSGYRNLLDCEPAS